MRDLCSTEDEPLTEPDIAHYMGQILRGLHYLHSRSPHPIIHLDLKGENVVLTRDRRTAKLCDLDSSREMRSSITCQSDVSAMLGTIFFMSPEMMMQSSNIGRATDVWSLGCVVLEMFGRGDFNVCAPTEPFITRSAKACSYSDLNHIIRNGGRPDIPAGTSTCLRDFVAACLRRTAEERPNTAVLLNDDFIVKSKDVLHFSKRADIGPRTFSTPRS